MQYDTGYNRMSWDLSDQEQILEKTSLSNDRNFITTFIAGAITVTTILTSSTLQGNSTLDRNIEINTNYNNNRFSDTIPSMELSSPNDFIIKSFGLSQPIGTIHRSFDANFLESFIAPSDIMVTDTSQEGVLMNKAQLIQERNDFEQYGIYFGVSLSLITIGFSFIPAIPWEAVAPASIMLLSLSGLMFLRIRLRGDNDV
jgi:hypothetical protein